MTEVVGTKLTTITVDATTPDVIGSLIQEITNRVMKMIPDGTFEKIASEIISDGKVIYRVESKYSGSTTTTYSLVDSTKKFAAESIEKQIKNLTAKYLESKETQKAISDLVEIGISDAMREIPKVAAFEVIKRMTGAFIGTHEEQYRNLECYQNRQRIDKIVDELRLKNIIHTVI